METVASWTAPLWASSVSTDDASVIHTRALGEIPVQGGQAFVVELVQRDELMVDEEGSTSYIRQPVYLRLGPSGDTVAAHQIRELSRMFELANDLVN